MIPPTPGIRRRVIDEGAMRVFRSAECCSTLHTAAAEHLRLVTAAREYGAAARFDITPAGRDALAVAE